MNTRVLHPATVVCGLLAIAALADDGEPRDSEGAARLEQMKARAQGTTVYVRTPARQEATLAASPIMRYNDLPRRFEDATLWLWTLSNRPVAVCKIEDHRPSDTERVWITCLSSLSDGLISAEWNSGGRWSASEPGVQLKELPDAPRASANASRRLRQLKALARRFSATMIREGDSQEMRMLPRPLYRYKDAEHGLIDGAVFALTANGTNPDFLLVAELHRDADSQSISKYGIAPVTADALQVELDGEPVWNKGFSRDGRQPTFMFMFEREPRNFTDRNAAEDRVR